MNKQHYHLGNGTYFGGKGASGVVHAIINQIPLHSTFVSGFLGRCAVMRWKRPATRSIGFEIDPAVFSKWSRIFQSMIELHNEDFLTTGLQMPELQQADTFLYLDPPYMLDTLSSRSQYAYKLTDRQHLELLQAIKALPCMVAISCYDSEFYELELQGWRKISFSAQSQGGQKIETLYMNYPEPAPDQLHDKDFLGDNFRKREKAKRRITTIKTKIGRLDPTEKARLRDWLQDLVTSLNPARLDLGSQTEAILEHETEAMPSIAK